MPSKNNDTPVLVALGAVAFLLFLIFLALLVPHQTGGSQIASQASAQQPPNSDLWDWVAKDSISFFTLVLAFLTGGLVYTGIQQIRIMRDAHEASGRLETITERQMLISGQQTDILEKQKEIQRQEFLVSHRPKIRMRLLAISPITIGQPVTVKFTLVNIGEADAIDISGSVVLTVTTGPRVGPIGEAKWMETFSRQGTALPAGGHLIVSIPTKAIPDSTWGLTLESPETRVIIHGRIGYKDARGVERLTGFLRRCSGDPNRFFSIGDRDIMADYDYED